MDTYLWRTALWYGGVGLLAAQVLRSLALPPKYFRLIVVEVEVMGVRSLGVALTAAIFTGMVFALQSAVNMARFGAENYVGPIAALAILRELGPVLTAILVGGKAPILQGALLSTMIVPFMKLEPPYTELKDLIARILDWWDENGKMRERVGELINRLGMRTFLRGVGLKPVPQMVKMPRTNPYGFFWPEDIKKGGK